MNPSDVPIPERLQKFTLWQGKFLVHYTVFVGKDGVPDFKVVNETKRIEALAKRLCHLCGQKLNQEIVFIGGPLCEKYHGFVDGPMHEECAKYAIQVCPYLVNPKHGHSQAESKPKPGFEISVLDVVTAGRPPKMALFYTNSYQITKQNGHIIIVAGDWNKIDWDTIPRE